MSYLFTGSTMTPNELKKALSSGLLSFPLTDFDKELRFEPKGYAKRLEWLMPYGATVLFAAGGTGEFFSLTADEYSAIVGTAVATCRKGVPIVAGTGGPTRQAIAFAQEAERLGAQGVLLLAHYLTEAGQEGLAAHVEAVCRSVKFGVIIYNRGACRLQADTLAKLAERCPNLVGFKDGIGNIELMVSIRRKLGDRFAYLGGLPTAEVYAAAYKALGVPVYSSAVFTFILPYLQIRDRKQGYAVSIIKAGAKLVGHDAGPVRTPLTDLTEEEVGML